MVNFPSAIGAGFKLKNSIACKIDTALATIEKKNPALKGALPDNYFSRMNNSEILIYQTSQGDIKIDVRLEEETVWLAQAQMVQLFGKDKRTISEHIDNIFKEGELEEKSVVRNFRITAADGKNYDTNHYNLDVIISVGSRVKSQQGTRFRIWATKRLKEYIIKGFALNDERFKTGSSINYFTKLQERIREIRISERFFYQKIKEIREMKFTEEKLDFFWSNEEF